MFTEDLDEFLGTDVFAQTGTFTPTSGSPSSLAVIFDEAYAPQFGIAATNPVVMGKASDFGASVTVGGTLVLGAVTFTIRERELMDDGALVRLQLSRP